MNGHIVNRGKNTWGIVLETQDKVGKRKQKWISFEGNKTAAKAMLRDLLHGQDNGDFVEPSKMTVAQFLSLWLDHKEGRVADKTLDRWQEIIDNHIDPAFGYLRIQDIDWQHLDAYYRKARKSGRLDGKGGLAERTLLHHHRLLDNAMKYAIKKKVRKDNPCEAADTPSPRGSKAHSLDKETIQAIINEARDHRLYAPVVVDYTTGLRRGELLGLRWSDIDFTAGTLTVAQVVQVVKRVVSFKEPKSERSARTLRLPAPTLEVLKTHQLEQKKFRLKIGKDYQNNDLVFCEVDGGVWHPDRFTGLFRGLVDRAGVKANFHLLRHTHATELLAVGTNPRLVSDRLGHSTVAFTLDVYGHVIPDMEVDALEKIGVGIEI